jgi:hypothetical protein
MARWGLPTHRRAWVLVEGFRALLAGNGLASAPSTATSTGDLVGDRIGPPGFLPDQARAKVTGKIREISEFHRARGL